jgi:predicted HTH domain antitoxin
MREATFEVRIPAELLDYGYQPEDIQHQIIEWLVLSLFKDGHVSSGKAAKLLSLTRIEFLALLRRRGIAYIDYSPTELAEEFAAAKALAVGARS